MGTETYPMCRWCVRYQKIERLAKTIEDAYGPQSWGFEEERGKRTRVSEPAAKSTSKSATTSLSDYPPY